MDHQSLTNVLNILRLMRTNSEGTTTTLITSICGSKYSEEAHLKVAAYMIEQVRIAAVVINESRLSEEAKQGVAQVLVGMTNTFRLGHQERNITAYVNDIPSAISNFVILISALDIGDPKEVPEDVGRLVDDIVAVQEQLNDLAIDPAVRDVAKRHLAVLHTLLLHIPIFGLEPALTTYFELITRLRRADIGASEEARSKFEPIWEAINKWRDRLASADKVWNSGARLLGHATKAGKFLDYIP